MDFAYRFASEAAFDLHCDAINVALAHLKTGHNLAALAALDRALEHGNSPQAHYNRAIALFALGQHQDAVAEYGARWAMYADVLQPRARQLRQDLPLWRGEPLAGRRLVVLHEAGFGDTIMLARFIAKLRREGADIAVEVPAELKRLLAQLAPPVGEVGENDVQCTTFELLGLQQTIPPPPYLAPDPQIELKWRRRFNWERRCLVGVTWSTARPGQEHRSIPLARLARGLERPGELIVSLQAHGKDEAEACGVAAPDYEDFADLAGLMPLMDRIVSIDTAALNLACAIGHKDVTVLLPAVPCWRWQSGAPWYPNLKRGSLDDDAWRAAA